MIVQFEISGFFPTPFCGVFQKNKISIIVVLTENFFVFDQIFDKMT